MNSEPQNIDILQNLEFAVIEVWRRHREIVERHTKHDGRQGYLTFANRFLK